MLKSNVDATALAEGAEWLAQALIYPDESAPMDTPAVIAGLYADPARLLRERQGAVYCSLFDVGKPEPAAPLQEGFYHDDPHTRLRRVVNFYRQYEVSQQTRWAPDHLCVELFFLAYLLRLLAAFPDRADLAAAASSFARLHLGSFVHACAQRVRGADDSGVYTELFDGLCRYLTLLGVEPRIATTTIQHSTEGTGHDA